MPPAPRESRSNVSTAPVAKNTSNVSSVISLKRCRARLVSSRGGPSSHSTALQPKKAIAAIPCSHLRTTNNPSATGPAGTLQLAEELLEVGSRQRVPLADEVPVGGDEVRLGHA